MEAKSRFRIINVHPQVCVECGAVHDEEVVTPHAAILPCGHEYVLSSSAEEYIQRNQVSKEESRAKR